MGLFSFTDGLKNIFGATFDVIGAPAKATLGGDPVGATADVIKAPFRLAGGTIQASLGTVTAPVRVPYALASSVFGGSSRGVSGAQKAFEMYLARGYSPTSQLYLPPGYAPYRTGGC